MDAVIFGRLMHRVVLSIALCLAVQTVDAKPTYESAGTFLYDLETEVSANGVELLKRPPVQPRIQKFEKLELRAGTLFGAPPKVFGPLTMCTSASRTATILWRISAMMVSQDRAPRPQEINELVGISRDYAAAAEQCRNAIQSLDPAGTTKTQQ